jgi:hypothetical protein
LNQDNFIIERIIEISKKLCKDYPNVENISPEESLWAIEQTFIGTNMANEDLHKVIKAISIEYNISNEKLFEISEKAII